MTMRRSLCTRGRLAGGAVALLLAVLALLLAGPRASAAPADAITLDDLQQAMDDNGGTLNGYFKTVLEDDVIVTIPATVRSIVPNMTQDGALILFEASGPEITAIGGIAQGMSGSPLYVDVPGPDKLAGAVSYGDMMTLDNMGLATPIEYMAAIEDRYLDGVSPAPAAARAATLATPLAVGGETVKRVVVASSLAAAKSVKAAEGTVVFAPLTVVQIGGLHPKTAAYKAAKAKLEAMGFSVVAPAAGMSAGYDPAWSTTLTGGASMAGMFARGDYWSGAAGTVTYVDGTDLLGFGHPLAWLGETDMYLTNALVSGIWKSGYVPYKLMAPAALRGSVTQDRNSGVAGRIGPVPADTVVTSSATFNGVTETSSSTTVRSLSSTSDWCWLPVSAAEVPVYKAIDAFALAGSAETTTTVVVSDGAQDYTLTRHNLYDSRSDVTYAAVDDMFMILTMLTDDPDGVAPATIKSVDFDGAFTKSRNSARIVSVAVPGGLRVGTNDVQVSLAIYGQTDLETVHVSLVIPEGVLPFGTLHASGIGEDYSFEEDALLAPTSSSGDDRRTLAEVVDTINELPANNDLTVEYWSEQSYEEPDVTVVTGTDWVVQGERRMSTSSVTLRAAPKTVNYGAATLLWGWVEGPSATTTVDVYAKPLGGAAQTLIATVPAIMNDGVAEFEYQVPSVTKNTTYTAQWAGDGDFLAAKRSVSVSVRPWVRLSADPTSLRLGKSTVLTAIVRPVLPVRTVTIQRRTASGAWVTVTKKTATADGKAVVAWKPPRTGTYVLRAVAGSGTSKNVTITVKP
jgi:hypothetical protein